MPAAVRGGGARVISLPRAAALRRTATPRTRILLTTEGTYPYAVGGVSSWCDLLVKRLSE
ncbi:MAG: DUF3492 domain-containing protein, partial [Actinomycetota bacterium]|nr:DUF3492 domain-containing protein [Actinomycetota bacterium]